MIKQVNKLATSMVAALLFSTAGFSMEIAMQEANLDSNDSIGVRLTAYIDPRDAHTMNQIDIGFKKQTYSIYLKEADKNGRVLIAERIMLNKAEVLEGLLVMYSIYNQHNHDAHQSLMCTCCNHDHPAGKIPKELFYPAWDIEGNPLKPVSIQINLKQITQPMIEIGYVRK